MTIGTFQDPSLGRRYIEYLNMYVCMYVRKK